MMVQSSDERPAITWALLRRVLSYATPYRGWLAGMLACILGAAGLSLLTPLLLREMIDHTLPAKDLARQGWLVCGLLVLPFLINILNVFQRRWNAQVGEGVVFDLRVSLFSHLQRMSLGFFTQTKVGELMSRLNNDVVGAQNAISNTLVNIITNLIQAAVFLGIMIALEWRLTLISIAILPFFLVVASMLGRRLRDITRKQMDNNARMNAMMNELLNVSGALLVKLFGRASEEDDRFRERAGKVRESGVERAVTGMLFFVSIGLLSTIGMAFVYGVGGILVIQDSLTIGTIIAMGAYLGSLYSALQGLANAPVEFATSMVSFERVFEVLDLPLEIEERAGAKTISDAKGRLAFQNVSFHYEVSGKGLLKDIQRFGSMQNVKAVLSGEAPERGKKGDDLLEEELIGISQARERVLENIHFEANPGELIALVGPSGAGKTTLTYLIPRLFDPTGGAILLDGMDIRDLKLRSLSSQIGMVTQETYLFHDTIRMNLLYARTNAPQSELEAAARAANIHDFIMGLPDRYDTVVGERGYRLSGGEKQRLAIARVILKNPRILVLDEATSSLDSESEALIQQALKTVMAGRTSIVIAHRLSTILAADQILVMDRGRIVEHGVHAFLLEENGLYARLYHTQFRNGISNA